MNFDFPYVLEVIPAIMKYVPLTLFMSILAMAVAILIGILLAVMKESKKAVLRGFTSIYLSFFRSVPTLVLLFIIYYGLPQLFPSLTAMEAVTAAIIGLVSNKPHFWRKYSARPSFPSIKASWKPGFPLGCRNSRRLTGSFCSKPPKMPCRGQGTPLSA